MHATVSCPAAAAWPGWPPCRPAPAAGHTSASAWASGTDCGASCAPWHGFLTRCLPARCGRRRRWRPSVRSRPPCRWALCSPPPAAAAAVRRCRLLPFLCSWHRCPARLQPTHAPQHPTPSPPPPQFPLPFALFELYRFCDGQDAARGGVQFLDAARLLSLQEMLQAAQDRYSPLETRRAFEGLTHQRRGEAAAAAAETRRERGGHEQAAGSSSGGGSPSGSSSGRHCVGGWPPEPPAVLLTFTDELRGRKRYCIDLQGRIWLSSGFNDIFLAPNLAALIHRILT